MGYSLEQRAWSLRGAAFHSAARGGAGHQSTSLPVSSLFTLHYLARPASLSTCTWCHGCVLQLPLQDESEASTSKVYPFRWCHLSSFRPSYHL